MVTAEVTERQAHRQCDKGAARAFSKRSAHQLVFLIDWNKARKVLRAWLPKADAVRVLDWAARNRFGHRGFLELGGSDLVASAVHHAAPARIGFGERLDHALGRDAAVDFIKTVLRVSAESLLEGGSVRQARDRIEADLVRHMQRVDATLLAPCKLRLRNAEEKWALDVAARDNARGPPR
jgi:hypothetical protein